MTSIGTMPVMRMINRKCFVFVEPFEFFSDVLGRRCTIPIGFETDLESVPIFRGTSPISGIIHDYVSRKDSEPMVSKKIAADVYLEFLKFRGTGFFKRHLKSSVVRVAPKYFHRFNVLDPVYSESL